MVCAVRACAIALSLAVAPAPPAPGSAAMPESPRASSDAAWRGARWGAPVEGILQAFPGEAKRLEPELKLADGNVVAAGIDGYRIGPHTLNVRFVFGDGKLVLVSLRTPPDRHAGVDVFQDLAGRMERELGAPQERTADAELVDLRQVRWRSGRTQVDLKYIPGVVALVYSPAPAEQAP